MFGGRQSDDDLKGSIYHHEGVTMIAGAGPCRVRVCIIEVLSFATLEARSRKSTGERANPPSLSLSLCSI